MYSIEIKAMSENLLRQVARRQLSWGLAAREANTIRNEILEIMRNRSTPIGRAYAEKMKATGKSLNTLIAEKTILLFGESADFKELSSSQKNKVFAEIVKSSGKSRPSINLTMSRFSRAGRSLIILSVALSVYEIAMAEDKIATTQRELAVTGAGIGGSIAGGALAGLACGPGAPVCVTVGAFVGGALFAFGASSFW